MGADEMLRDANWKRMRSSIERAATEYRRIADDLEAINFDSTKGIRRSPDAVISQAALTADPGRVFADLMHRLATWAESINEIPKGAIESTGEETRRICGYQIGGSLRTCVLIPGHDLPVDDGLTVHVDEDGVMFA